jgi:hypothetical protein
LFAVIGFLGWQLDSPIAISGAQISAPSLLILGVRDLYGFTPSGRLRLE